MIQLFNEDCLETMKRIPDGSIDLMLTDPPYGVTQNDWDIAPNFAEMWLEWERILKPDGAWIFFAQQPFCTDLIVSGRGFFKYDLIWHKSRPTGFLNANRMPLREHEHILVFYRTLPTFNPIKKKGNPNHVKNGSMSRKNKNNNYGDFGETLQVETDEKNPTSVLYFNQQDPTKLIHPTEKPLDIMRYFIQTYSNENDIIFDGYCGSGTTAVACIKEKRNFIGSELNKEYYDKAALRIKVEQMQPALF